MVAVPPAVELLHQLLFGSTQLTLFCPLLTLEQQRVVEQRHEARPCAWCGERPLSEVALAGDGGATEAAHQRQEAAEQLVHAPCNDAFQALGFKIHTLTQGPRGDPKLDPGG